MDTPLLCPVCDGPLSWGERACLCDKGHSFDLAAEGYANLLLSNLRRSRHPGDNADMVKARRRFFDHGSFDPLTELIRKEVCRLAVSKDQPGPVSIMDAGCGEGHFLGAIGTELKGDLFGVDVSKEAVRIAARRHPGIRWIVANVMRRLPFADGSLNVILSVLAPRNAKEFARILKPGGSLAVVVPGPDHLIELRSRLMARTVDHGRKKDEAIEACAPYLVDHDRRELSYELSAGRAVLSDLVQMTPLFWRSTQSAKSAIQELDELKVTMNFILLVFRPA